MRRPLVLTIAFLTLAALAQLGSSTSSLAAQQGQFATPCAFSHTLSDDPIVFPAQPGASHSHDFIGNRSTDAYSNYESLRAGDTTCRRPADTAAYWVPALLRGAHAITPTRAQIYYLQGAKPARTIRAFPPDLRVIAGDARATSPQRMSVTRWSCGPDAGRSSSSIPRCPAGSSLRLHIRFPDCWNGLDLDTADHRSHMAYAESGVCPLTHPIGVPRISLNVIYPTRGGTGFSLASGGLYSGHADFLNAWRQQTLEALVRNCINAQVHCGRGNG